jgi:predicted dehydrogenase
MAEAKLRVGIIGANVRYGWGSSAHIPALRVIPGFEITAVCTSRQQTADETAKHFGIPLAFADVDELVRSPEVDLVSICVRVPFHYRMGMAALNSGKHLFCEWPLAATTEQARQMRDLAASKGLANMVGLQARGAPPINRLRDLIREGYVGRVLSCTLVVSTPNWGSEFTPSRSYLADRSTGATLLTIPGGHSIDALCYCLGEFKSVSSVVATQRSEVKITETNETVRMTSPDQVLVSGVLESGAVASVHIKGGTANGTPLLFEIHGTGGDLLVAPARPGSQASVQISELTIRGSQRGKPLEQLPIPESYRVAPAAVPAGPALNVGQLFARMAQDLRAGRASDPGFELAFKRHALLDAIQKASDTGVRQNL